MNLPGRVAIWRTAAAVLWIASLLCLFKAIGDGILAEESLYNPRLTDVDRVAIHHLSQVADRWSTAGWTLQLAVAATLCAGLSSANRVRRVFHSVGLLIAVDGVALLLVVIIIR